MSFNPTFSMVYLNIKIKYIPQETELIRNLIILQRKKSCDCFVQWDLGA